MDSYQEILASSAQRFNKLTAKPQNFIISGEELVAEFKLLAKVVYDLSKLTETNHDGKTLTDLIIDGFDEEQVWAGVELQNAHRLSQWRSSLTSTSLLNSSLLLGAPQLYKKAEESSKPEISASEAEDSEPGQEEDEAEDSEADKEEQEPEDFLNDPDFQNMSDSEGDDLPLFEDLSEDDVSDEAGDGQTYKMKERKKQDQKATRPTVVDDQFFKLSEMGKFLDLEDQKESRRQKEDHLSDEDEMDLFEDPGGSQAEENLMYADFFQESGDAGEKANKFYGDDEEDEEEEDSGKEGQSGEESDSENKNGKSDILRKGSGSKNDLFDDSDKDESEEQVKSSHEAATERLKKRISKLEEEAVGDKKWQMGGEVAAPLRPENSLLAEDLDYDSAVRQAPVFTEEVARKLEDIIRQRIKDKAWDDVERKVKPIEDPKEYRKKLVLDQEKSKLSLAQVYEQEFLKVAEAKEKAPPPSLLHKDTEDTPKEVEEIKAAMRTLFSKLDTLTHFQFTPKQKSAEVKIVRNLPSIAMEEVAPVGVSSADLLAPSEIVEPGKGELMAAAERTATDRKRLRREKKAKKRAAIKAKEQRRAAAAEKQLPGGGGEKTQQRAAEKIGKMKKSSTDKTKKSSEKSVKSSTAFFTALQDEVKSQVEGKTKKKPKDGARKSVASLKL